MNSGQKEIVIRISDWGGAILRAIKPVLAFVLIFALLGAAFGARKAMKAAAGVKVNSADLAAATQTLYESEQLASRAEFLLATLREIDIPNAEETLRLNEKLLQGWEDYAENSVFYSLDPFHCGVSRVTLLFSERVPSTQDVLINNTFTDVSMSAMTVNGNESVSQKSTISPENEIKSNEAAFTDSVVSDSALIEGVTEIMGVDLEPKYVNELVRVTSPSEQVVEITVYFEDLERARQVTDYLLDELLKRLDEEDSLFSATLISRYDGYDVDWNLVDEQKTERNEYNQVRTDYNTAKVTLKMLNDDEEATVLLLEGRRENTAADAAKVQKMLDKENKTPLSMTALLKNAIRYGVVFFAMAAILACGVVFLSQVLSGRLQNVNSAILRYPFPVIGILPKKKKRWFEKSIRRLEGEPEAEYDAAGRAIAQSLVSLAGDRRIALVSSEDVSLMRDLTEYTGDRIPVCGNLLKDADAVKAAEQYDGFVLVEEKGKSRYDLINAEISRIRTLDKKIEGIVLL